MRLAEEKIKEAILHPDSEIRVRAVSYFADSDSPDPSIMPLVIQAVEKYGKEESVGLVAQATSLRQTADTIAWVVQQLNGPESDEDDPIADNLSRVLVEADPTLLLPHETAILEAPRFNWAQRDVLTEKLRLLSWDEATCWQKLEEFCEEAGNTEDIEDVSFEYSNRLAEALGRYGRQGEARIRELLSHQADYSRNNPMQWREPILCVVAGLARLESTVPLLVSKLHEEVDFLSEDCTDALIRIGTPAVVEAVAEAYLTGTEFVRLDALAPLEHIHSDLAVEKALNLLTLEQDPVFRRYLATALLGQFAHEGIEAARQLLVGRSLDAELRDLRSLLLETCTIMGEPFPEYEKWLAEDKAEREAEERRRKAFEGSPRGQLRRAVEQLSSMDLDDLPDEEFSAVPPVILPIQREVKQKVGRNDPCPCGSGKKFKKCCLNK